MHRHACIIGAGIVGCATAYALARDGWRVTLVDALAAPGQGASLANGAQLSYSYVEPLASPAALRALPAWLLQPGGPARWRPRGDAEHWTWLAAFVRACSQAQARQTTAALLALSFLSRRTLHTWLAELPGVAEAARFARPGKLVLHRDAGSRAAAQRQLDWKRSHGCGQQLLSGEECLAIEPALAPLGSRAIAFGVWTPDEEVIDGPVLAAGWAEASRATLHLGRTVLGFEPLGAAPRALRLADGNLIEADQFVMAAGTASAVLMRGLGQPLPIEPIKGYSITLPIVDEAAAPRASITDVGRKTVYARLGHRLRVAGFAELVGFDTRIAQARIEALVAATEAAFPGACDTREESPWTGLRPATPSGRPFVGRTRWPNLWLNSGHGPLGLTLAAGSAALLAAAMAGEAPPIDASPFAPPA
ncbi:FAD-dependent oxidoreductase [Ideonella sp. YS5]|uniref:FAD-dependent oxidoreductase n=1 Tax=Ideonella sp. YS5 TaxID=3453714 RepID=UPI003EEFCE35